MSSDELRRIALEVGTLCLRWADQDHDEREVVTLFVDKGFFLALGYGQVGEDIRLELKAGGGRADVTLKTFSGRPVCLIEFKRCGEPLRDHFSQLAEYARHLLPDYTALTNGVDLLLFEVRSGSLHQVLECRLPELGRPESRQLYQGLVKREVDLTRLAEIRKALEACRTHSVRAGGPAEPGGQAFLERFSLDTGSAFGRVVAALCEALPTLVVRSEFTAGAFEFWRRAYSRDLSHEDVPKTWLPYLLDETKEGRQRFMFALETAYAVLSRAILVKAMGDARFPDLDALAAFESALDQRDRHGTLSLLHYVESLGATFEEGGKQAFRSLFSSDIFDWWKEIAELENPEPLAAALAEAIVAAFQFNFGDLEGDLLGELYQAYFDADTRKALGEFYTPPEIVDFILTRVGYQGLSIRATRLLDPACGSGTFLIHAIRRYLNAMRGEQAHAILRDLMGGLRIIGFDINPFACLMAQINYAAQILPLYGEALRRDPNFSVPTIPVFRTDSLRKETREEDLVGRSNEPQLVIRLEYQGEIALIRVELPVRVGDDFLEVEVPVPRYDRAREQGLVTNPEEYFALLRCVFDAVREERTRPADIEDCLRRSGLTVSVALVSYVEPTIRAILNTLQKLREQYQDGRFLKTLEDVALALVLKNDLKYDYVVGNPPYVRIQNIPPLFRRRWERLYSWTEGNFDIFVPFIERGVTEWLASGGRLSFICSNRFLLLEYAATLRAELATKSTLAELVDLRDSQVFRDALNYPAIFIVNRSTPSPTDTFPVARVFSDPGEGAHPLLEEISEHFTKIAGGASYARGAYSDAFRERCENLSPDGWRPMPQAERGIFEHLRAAAPAALTELTVTGSAAFQGFASGLDEVLVLKKVGERQNRFVMEPRGGGPRVEIEAAAVRPFLFGRDVERWYIAWRGWFVAFPYIEVGGKFRLLPSREYAARFEYSDQCEWIEDTFPLLWEYLNGNERVLRNREKGRYRRRKADRHLWYGAARPQNLEHYPEGKILLQVSSQTSDMTLDDEGGYVFTAGGTSGVYGIRLKKELDRHLILGLLNSPLLDFYLKHVSATYAGHSYSYGDQFLKLLPIKLPKTRRDQDIAAEISKEASSLMKRKAELRNLERRKVAFPGSILERVETYSLKRLMKGALRSAQVQAEQVERLLFPGSVRIGRASVELPSEAHVDVLLAWVRLQERRVLEASGILDLQMPRRPEDCAGALRGLASLEGDIERVRQTLSEHEKHLDELVSDYYEVPGDGRSVVGDFLARF